MDFRDNGGSRFGINGRYSGAVVKAIRLKLKINPHLGPVKNSVFIGFKFDGSHHTPFLT
jgi:hypothetical protein